MLLINVKAGQAVLVGKHNRLTVDSIDQDLYTAQLSYRTRISTYSWRTKVGKPLAMDNHVNVTVTRVNEGRDVTVTLGFDAPRRISIRGEWVGEKSRTDYVTLKGMPPDELIATAEREAQTDLERVLLDTLKMFV